MATSKVAKVPQHNKIRKVKLVKANNKPKATSNNVFYSFINLLRSKEGGCS